MAIVMRSLSSSTKSISKRHRKNYKEREKEKLAKYGPTAPAPIVNRLSTIKRSRRCIDNANHSLRKQRIARGGTLPLDRRSSDPIIEFQELTRPGNSTDSRIDEGSEEAEKRLQKMCGAVRMLLECVGEDPDREGLLATPSRYAKALLVLTEGYQIELKDVVNNALFHEQHHEMVIVKDIEIYSICEHHLIPFTGKMHIGYIPSNIVIGLSKLPRIAKMFSRRLQVQERLTKEIAGAIMQTLNPQGVAVIMESSHLCMMMRGVEKTGTTTITYCALGSLKKPEVRNEFTSLVGINRT
ncbi:GTP cyclohydrolase 1 [Meristemomyces frigidus]|uniref:GTP cyclohydrolase 1 n=1 Tax=Meristemomyces frigidus TaxID=1508187 RepID=A0AAN7T9H1_9PEZI|nr:GTP cyclohydrolase 1 [Meristemomyces frigidus]